MTITTLDTLTEGQTATVKRLAGERAIRRRLMDMGLTPRATVEMVKASPFGDPVEYRIRGYSLSLRKSEARMVEVEI